MKVDPHALPGPFTGLSVKLIATIIAVIFAVEVAVYVPSIANFRASWLEDRLQVGVVAARVLDTAPDVMAVPQTLTDRLLSAAGAQAIVYRRSGMSQLIQLEGADIPTDLVVADMRNRNFLSLMAGAVDTLFGGNGRTLRIIGTAEEGSEDGMIEILMSEAPLRHDLFAYSRNIVFLSLALASMTALVLYLFVSRSVLAPIRRLTGNMLAYRKAPENASLIITPSPRNDEIGRLERDLAAMETEIHTLLRQRRHMADLGLAVAKIIHDLRNTLTSAQLLSDQVAGLEDPKVQRLAPRLVHTLDRAISFAQSVLDHSRESAAPPRPVATDLRALIEEASFDAGLVAHPSVVLDNAVPEGVVLDLDPEQMTRVLVNLLKNAREALEAAAGEVSHPQVRVDYSEEGEGVLLSIADNGPGLPPRARENLFIAFEGSARSGGTGLGLAIAQEITQAHGGRVELADTQTGTRFDIHLPATLRRA